MASLYPENEALKRSIGALTTLEVRSLALQQAGSIFFAVFAIPGAPGVSLHRQSQRFTGPRLFDFCDGWVVI